MNVYLLVLEDGSVLLGVVLIGLLQLNRVL